jgi:hypothetical protein
MVCRLEVKTPHPIHLPKPSSPFSRHLPRCPRRFITLMRPSIPALNRLAPRNHPCRSWRWRSSFLAPFLGSATRLIRRQAFLQEGWLANKTLVPTHKSVHTQKYMFTEYDSGEYELYDLSIDPYQLESKPRAGNEQLYSELQTRALTP